MKKSLLLIVIGVFFLTSNSLMGRKKPTKPTCPAAQNCINSVNDKRCSCNYYDVARYLLQDKIKVRTLVQLIKAKRWGIKELALIRPQKEIKSKLGDKCGLLHIIAHIPQTREKEDLNKDEVKAIEEIINMLRSGIKEEGRDYQYKHLAFNWQCNVSRHGKIKALTALEDSVGSSNKEFVRVSLNTYIKGGKVPIFSIETKEVKKRRGINKVLVAKLGNDYRTLKGIIYRKLKKCDFHGSCNREFLSTSDLASGSAYINWRTEKYSVLDSENIGDLITHFSPLFDFDDDSANLKYGKKAWQKASPTDKYIIALLAGIRNEINEEIDIQAKIDKIRPHLQVAFKLPKKVSDASESLAEFFNEKYPVKKLKLMFPILANDELIEVLKAEFSTKEELTTK